MRKLLVLIILAATAWGAEPLLTPEARKALSSITANDLRADVSFLASDALEGRATPSRGLDIAAEYIAAQFRRAGLEPAGDDGYFQTAEYVSVTPKTDGLEFAVEIGGKMFRVPAERILIQNARGIQLERVETVRVAAETEVPATGVEGKIALIEAPDLYAGFRKVSRSREQLSKAAAAIIVANSVPGRAPRSRLVEANEPQTPPILIVGDADLLKTLQSGTAPAVATLRLHEPASEHIKLRNVVAMVRGSDPALKDSYVLLSAHYDHLGTRASGEGDRIFNGANDDASGTASMIAAAHAIAQAPPKRTVLFIAWFGEETGGYGARYYVRHPIVPLAKTDADVNLEQTGRTDDTHGPVVKSASLTGFDYSEVGQILADAGKETGVNIGKDEKRSDDYFGRSDNLTLAMAGVPAHTLCVAYEYPDYHRASDEWPKLDYGNMETVTRAIAAGVWTLAERQEPVKWDESNPKAARYAAVRKEGTEKAKADAR